MTKLKFVFGLGTAALVALFACGSGTGGGGSCLESLIGSSCYSCAQSNCGSQLSTFDTACSNFLACTCPGGSLSCSAVESTACQQEASAPTCTSAGKNISACTQQYCANQCGSSVACADAGGGVSTVTCTGSGSAMADACSLGFCTATSNGSTSCYYEVGSQEFPCTSCSDTTSCEQAAMAVCK